MYNVISVWEGPMVRPSPKAKPLVGLMYTSGSTESSLSSLIVVGTYFQNDSDVGRPRPSDDQCLARKVTYYQ